MADPTQQDMEIALRDNVSVVLKTASQLLDAFNRKMIETGKSGDTSLESIRKKFNSFNEEGGKTVKTVQELDKSFLGLGKTLTVGVAGGFVAVAKALDTFAVSQLQLGHFAQNVGLAVGEVNKYQQQAQRAGVDPQQAAAAMQSMHNFMKDIYVNQTASANFRRLQEMNPVLAQNVLTLLNQRKEMEAIIKVRESYFRAPAMGRYRTELQDMTGMTATMFEVTKDKLVGAPELWVANEEAAKRYHERVSDLVVMATNVKNMILTGFILGDEIWDTKPGSPTESISGPRGWAPGINPKPKGKFFTGAAATDMFLPGGAYTLQGEGGPERSMTGKEFWKSIGGAPGALDEDSELPRGANPIQFTRESLKIEEDTHDTLVGIYDILQRQEIQLASLGPGAGPSGNPFVTGAAPMGRLPGMPGGQRQAGPPAPSVDMPGTGPGAPITGDLWAGIGASRDGGRRRHAGFDVGAPHGSPVYAEEPGIIVKSEQQGGKTGGIVTVYYPGSGVTAKYMHMSNTRMKKKGDPVGAGEIVGLSGTAGGYQHLHVEYYDKSGRLIRPEVRHGWGVTGPTGEGLRGRKVFSGVPGSFPKGTTREQATAKPPVPPAPTAAPGPASILRQKEFLMEHRAKIMEELKDPQKKERLMGLAQAEVGNDPRAQQAFIETTIDRWAARGQTVEQGIASSYYGGNPRYRSPTEQTRKRFDEILGRTAAGSAMYPGATGNASGSVLRRHARAGEVAGEAGREGFVYEPQDAEFRRKLDEAMRGGDSKKGTVAGNVDFSGMKFGTEPTAEEPGVFKILNLGRTPQGGKAGGGVSDFNRFAFE